MRGEEGEGEKNHQKGEGGGVRVEEHGTFYKILFSIVIPTPPYPPMSPSIKQQLFHAC